MCTTFPPDFQRLKAVMEQRAKAFVNYRHFIAIRAKFFFQMMLSQRGYNGKMSFDHGNEILGLQVRLTKWALKSVSDICRLQTTICMQWASELNP